ncbi:hypothetical protein C8J57DRAFT_1728784 [Mycena rebaudengoi]|nr:hypothetical protein C8J57DRAFT_1728784 [Mycena rebaudengoi]
MLIWSGTVATDGSSLCHIHLSSSLFVLTATTGADDATSHSILFTRIGKKVSADKLHSIGGSYFEAKFGKQCEWSPLAELDQVVAYNTTFFPRHEVVQLPLAVINCSGGARAAGLSQQQSQRHGALRLCLYTQRFGSDQFVLRSSSVQLTILKGESRIGGRTAQARAHLGRRDWWAGNFRRSTKRCLHVLCRFLTLTVVP